MRLALALLALLAAAPAAPAAEVTVRMAVAPGLKFDPPRFAAAPGSRVRVIFHNGDEMIHNFVITRPGERLKVVTAALALGADGPARNFVPGLKEVLWSTRALNPGDTVELAFTAPGAEGVYPFVCTFPGHGFVMYGAMYVTTGGLPPLAADRNVPPESAAAAGGTAAPGDGLLVVADRPLVSRTFLPDCGPAAIAVGLPGGQSYCFDAGLCRLRYAWKGGFVDNTDQWDGKGDLWGKVVGRIYYRAPAGAWLRLGNPEREPVARWRGYRLDHGYPQFLYTLDGIGVRQEIRARQGGGGLEMSFELASPPGPVWLVTDPAGGAGLTSSAGRWSGGTLALTPAEARRFTVTLAERPRVEPLRYWSMNDALWSTNNIDPQPGVVGRAFTPGGLGRKPVVLRAGAGTAELKNGGALLAWVRVRRWPAAGAAAPVFSAGPAFVVSPPWRDGGWHHLAVVYPPGGPAVLYVDGARRDGAVPALPAADAELEVGSSGGRFLDGLLDEVRIYDRAPPADEIAGIYRREAAAGGLLPP